MGAGGGPFQKQSRAVTNCAPPNGCFHRASRCTDSASTCGEEPRLTRKPVKRGENAYGTPDPSPPASAALQKLYLWATRGSVSATAADTLIVDYAQSLAAPAIR